MSEKKEVSKLTEFVVKFLTDKGYELETAVQTTADVLEAHALYRQERYKKWVGQPVVVKFGSLKLNAIIHDLKIVDGRIEYQVKPVSGKGHLWVKSADVVRSMQ